MILQTDTRLMMSKTTQIHSPHPEQILRTLRRKKPGLQHLTRAPASIPGAVVRVTGSLVLWNSLPTNRLGSDGGSVCDGGPHLFQPEHGSMQLESRLSSMTDHRDRMTTDVS